MFQKYSVTSIATLLFNQRHQPPFHRICLKESPQSLRSCSESCIVFQIGLKSGVEESQLIVWSFFLSRQAVEYLDMWWSISPIALFEESIFQKLAVVLI